MRPAIKLHSTVTIALIEISQTDFDRIEVKDVTGVPIVWTRRGTSLDFWPRHNVVICEIIDLDAES
jgi:hypothetical protein